MEYSAPLFEYIFSYNYNFNILFFFLNNAVIEKNIAEKKCVSVFVESYKLINFDKNMKPIGPLL